MNKLCISHLFPLILFSKPALRSLCALPVFLIAGSLDLTATEPTNLRPLTDSQLSKEVEATIYAGWESRYFTEGRDSLDGDSLIVSQIGLDWERLSGEIWYGVSPDQSYDELQLTLAVVQAVGNFEFYAGYTHLQFPSDNSKDNEVSAGFACSNLPAGLEIAVDAYHSFEADGFFAELSAAREFAVTEEFAITCSCVYGLNNGYVADGHDGSNHIGLQLGFDYRILDSISIIAHVTQSWALERDLSFPGDETLVDFFHGGIGVQWSL